MSIEIVYCLQSKQKRNEGKVMGSTLRDILIVELGAEYNSWSEVIEAKDYIEKAYGWGFGVACFSSGLLYPIHCSGEVIREKDVFTVTEKDKQKHKLDGFSYWDNAWWRTC